MSDLPHIPLFIGGEYRSSRSGATYEVANPATGKNIERAAAATSDDVKNAIENAHEAFQTWQFSSPGARAGIFRKAVDLVMTEKYVQRIVRSVVEETGCEPSWAKMVNVDLAAGRLIEACDMAYAVKGEILPSNYGAMSFVQKVPMGVIFVASPWNAPVGLITMTAIPVIAAGNTVILKTSDSSPGGQLLVAELLAEAGLPSGVLNVVHISRQDASARVSEIIAHPAVRKIGFTGSERIGKLLAMEAAKHLKPCVLELGGKAPVIVLNDADVDAAAQAIVSGAVQGSGQVCIGTERLVVQRGVSQQLIGRIKAIASKITAGDQPSGAQLGCVFSTASAAHIISLVSEAVEEGAQLLNGDLKADGAFVQPHLVVGAKPGQRLWDQETFGPVLAIAVVNTVEEAIKMANASDSSLSSALWTSNMQQAFAIARRIRAGQVFVNGSTIGFETRFHQLGWGGSSGYGAFDVNEFVNVQLVSFQNAQARSKLPT